MKRFVSLLVLSFAAFAVHAQTVPAKLTARWVLPTESECIDPATDGTPQCVRVPLTGPYAVSGVRVYVSTSPIPDDSTMEPSATTGIATTLVYNQTVPNGSTLYVRLKAVTVDGAVSRRFSNQATKLVQVDATPGAPTDVTLELEITL